MRQMLSLDRPIDDEGHLLADTIEINADTEATRSSRFSVEDFQIVLTALPKRSRGILGLKFCLNGAEPKTVVEIAKIFYFSHGNICQLEARVFKRLQTLLEQRRAEE